MQRTGELVVSAIGSDDELYERLVLKGGNALQLIYKVGARASKDYDFSMQKDEDPEWLRKRLEKAVHSRFELEGYVVLDFRFAPRPQRQTEATRENPKWGGYNADFKFLSKDDWAAAVSTVRAKRSKRAKHEQLEEEELLEYRRNISQKVEVEISKHEYTEGKASAEVDGYPVYVYTLPMIAAEKLRAICQQMKEHGQRKNPAPRPRDFYDIHACVVYGKVDLAQSIPTLRSMFSVKDVPIELLAHIKDYRSFHANAWAQVESAVPGEQLQPFDYYFEFVLNEVGRLQAAGVI
ncbi:nucleotidyl transferase AbiEii/AbiGii toxin family protein [Myxococcus xanthus]|uniref:nucleotidyl transferase AbiEii/AbiGii toxin family protein n=1 Tax=Myxococcus xanthus TaxID=34 RepID=UPI001375B393|nr:nucleotidyl transferase AbiEii/AbiGii toxin family protein [Myxococcus xanthus]